MKNKKGFTLIELLAVIVILAVIALIATPIILNMINNARKKAAESSAYGFVEAIEYNNGLADISDDMGISYERVTGTNLDVTTINVKLKGKRPTSGTVTIDETGKVTTGDFCIEGYQVEYRGKEVTEVKKGCSSSSSSSSSETPTTPVTYTAYNPGDLVYFDPVSENPCDSTHITSETCYKWRVITVGDDSSKDNITLQMDHNLIDVSQWISMDDYNDDANYGEYGNSNKGPITIFKELENETSEWTKVPGLTYTYDTSASEHNYGTLSCNLGECTVKGNTITTNSKARIVTGEEIRAITMNAGAPSGSKADTWSLATPLTTNGEYNYYYFTNTQYPVGYNPDTYEDTTKSVSLSWLIENTRQDEYSGATANTYGSNVNGYWSLSPYSDYSYKAWIVDSEGYFSDYDVYDWDTYGIRPVIAINKSQISS